MELKTYRDRLDRIDEQIVALFRERMETVTQIAEYKKSRELPVYAPGREQEIRERVRMLSGEELAPYAEELFETLMRVSREYQAKLL